MNRTLLVLVMLMAGVSASLGQTKASSIRSEIEAASRGFAETLSKGEAAKIAGTYAEDARVLPPNGPAIQTRQKIQEFWQGFIDSKSKLSLSTSDVEAQGKVAIEVGTWEMVSADNKRDTGKFVVVWRWDKKDWKIAVEI